MGTQPISTCDGVRVHDFAVDLERSGPGRSEVAWLILGCFPSPTIAARRTIKALSIARRGDRTLSELVGRPIATVFTAHNVSRLYAYIKLEMYIAGLPADAAGDIAATTQQLALNSLQRGAAEVTVQMWNQPDALICEVVDDTVIDDLLLGRRVPVEDEHDGLWHANQLFDLVQMRSSSTGTTVRVPAWK
jgi:hypothetical protein